jgi:hypothetical protein
LRDSPSTGIRIPYFSRDEPKQSIKITYVERLKCADFIDCRVIRQGGFLAKTVVHCPLLRAIRQQKAKQSISIVLAAVELG